jgi:hypothetical protein
VLQQSSTSGKVHLAPTVEGGAVALPPRQVLAG